MKFNKRVKSATSGYSLIELLLVIAFIAGALVLAFVTYPKVQATNRANVESQHLSVISTGIKNLYATAKTFGGANPISNQVLLNAKLIPDDMRVNSTAAAGISNVWEGTVDIAPAAVQSKYTITYTLVPPAECAKMATGVAVNFMKLDVGATTIFDRTAGVGGSSGGSVDINPALVTTACSAAPGGSTMTFTGN